jgi:hypothetical protein
MSETRQHYRWESVWWEDGNDYASKTLTRMVVPGGWIYRLEGNGHESLTFVPNPSPAVTLTGTTMQQPIGATVIDGQAVGRTMLTPNPVADGVIRCSTGADVPGGGAS